LFQKHAIFGSFLSPFSAIFGLISTYVLKTEWSVAAAGVALRPAAMQIADRIGGFLVCVRAPPSISEWVDIWRIDGLLTQKLSEMCVLCGKLQFLFHSFSSL
jgi:hypothetical protein